MTVRRRLAGAGAVVAMVALGCAGDDDAADPTEAPATSASTVPDSTVPGSTVPVSTVPGSTVPGSTVAGSTVAGSTVPPEVALPALRAELLAMLEEDQAEQTGAVATNNYDARTARLAEILDEHGWPGIDLVGEDGSTAAWVIAQHADLDPDVQQRALELLRAAAADGQASLGDLAYLEDRVAVAAGDEQRYGTQVGCGPDGPAPATPIADEAGLESRRAEAGLPPYADYVEEMTAICAEVDVEPAGEG